MYMCMCESPNNKFNWHESPSKMDKSESFGDHSDHIFHRKFHVDWTSKQKSRKAERKSNASHVLHTPFYFIFVCAPRRTSGIKAFRSDVNRNEREWLSGRRERQRTIWDLSKEKSRTLRWLRWNELWKNKKKSTEWKMRFAFWYLSRCYYRLLRILHSTQFAALS